jgi:hypothetical protein
MMEETRKQKTADYKNENKLIGTRNTRNTKLCRIISLRGKDIGGNEIVSSYINIDSVGAHPSCRIKTKGLYTKICDEFTSHRAGRNVSVGIVPVYGLQGLGIESRWGRDYPRLSRPALGPAQPPVQWYRVFPGDIERSGRDADHSTTFSTVTKKE